MSDPTREGDAAREYESPRPEVWSSADGLGREGMVTVWDDQGCYLGCMGVELWRLLLVQSARAE